MVLNIRRPAMAKSPATRTMVNIPDGLLQTTSYSGDRYGYYESRVVRGLNSANVQTKTNPSDVAQWAYVEEVLASVKSATGSAIKVAHDFGRLRSLFLGL